MTISLENGIKWYFAINSTARKGAPLPMKMVLSIIKIVLPLSNKHIISTSFLEMMYHNHLVNYFFRFSMKILLLYVLFKKRKKHVIRNNSNTPSA